MRVFIANFGRGNWAWPECLRRKALAVMDDTRVHPFWKRGDKEGYIRKTQEELRLAGGGHVLKMVASRWFNLNSILMETDGDLWIHREKAELWWTQSSHEEPSEEIIDDPNPLFGAARIHVYYKPCSGWSNRDKKGRPLTWNGLHVKARAFLFTEGTFQKLADDNAAYAEKLIDGEPLSPWHDRADWRAKVEQAGRFPVTHFDSRQRTIARMAMTAMSTAKGSGAIVETVRKDKQFRFTDQFDLERHIAELLDAQESLCGLTGLAMVLDGEDGDAELRCSLDRIDSNGHYERGNLQIVCKFADRWKGSSDNAEFLRLIEKVSSSAVVE
jgi:hypothetical protein